MVPSFQIKNFLGYFVWTWESYFAWFCLDFHVQSRAGSITGPRECVFCLHTRVNMWQVLKGRVTGGNCSLSAGDISLQSAAGVFLLPACDKMGDTGRIPDIPRQALGNYFTQSEGPTCLCFPRVSLGSALQYCSPEISLQDSQFLV